MVSCGIAGPLPHKSKKWLFTQYDFARISRAHKFIKDLNIDIPGAAITLELFEDINNLRKGVI